FKQWFLDNNLGRFLGAERVGRPNTIGMTGARTNFFIVLPWFAWPAVPFACLALWKERATIWRQPAAPICCLSLLIALVVLSVSRNGRSIYGLPMLVPACLLGARGVRLLTERWSRFLPKGCAVGFGVVIVAMWIGWLSQFIGPAALWERIHRASPDYEPAFQ